MNGRHLPIGLFDSGVGGLTVMRELAALLPHENIVYFGDTARLPYGNKSPEAILRFAFENAAFLLDQKIKLLVVACHTACSHALNALQKALPVPVLGVTAPGVECLSRTTKTGSVAVLATSSTINSKVFQALLHEKRADLDIHAVACPLFVPLVEEGLQNHPATALIAEYYLSELRGKNIDAALLACTHYPLLSEAIQSIFGPSVRLIAPAKACAEQVKVFLETTELLNPEIAPPYYHFFASDDPIKFQYLAKSFFSKPIEKVILVQNKIL